MTAFRKPALFVSFMATGVIASYAYPQESLGNFATNGLINLTADSFEEDQANRTVTAIGNVEAAYDGRIMRADSAVYSRITKRLHAIGNVIVIDTDGTERFADEFEMDSDLSSGYAINFAVRMTDGGKAVASSAERREDGTDVMENIVYTACETCEDENPTWALRSRKAVRNEKTGLISYRHAVLEVGGVPVMYTPFLAHPDPSVKRKSGLLFPDLGVSSKLGTYYQQPVFHAISPYSDITVSPLIASGVNPLLELRYRKRFWSGELDLQTSFTYESEFDSRGDRVYRDANGVYVEAPDITDPNLTASEETFRGHIYAGGDFSLNASWRWGFGIENQTDSLYDRRYDIDGKYDQRGLYYNQPSRLLSQLYLQGQGENFFSEASTLSFQSQAVNGSNNDLSPVVAPLFYATRTFNMGKFGKFKLDGSTAILDRSGAQDSKRGSIGARWNIDKVWNGFVFSPFVEGNADYYKLDEDFSPESDTSRVTGAVGANLKYPLIKYASNGVFTIEPELLVVHASKGGNDSALIPNEDSVASQLDWRGLLRSDANFGRDLYEGGNKAAVSLKAAARFNNGVGVETRLGRRWRSQSDSVFTEASNLDGTVSDWMVNANLDLGPKFNLSADLRLDDDDLQANRVDFSANGQVGRFSGNLSYFKSSEQSSLTSTEVEGISLLGNVKLTNRFTASYSIIRDIENDKTTSQKYGLAYEDDCAIFQIYYKFENYDATALTDSESFGFSFTLKTLGTLGSREFD